MCGGGPKGPSKKEQKKERDRQEKAQRQQQKRYDQQLAQQRADADTAAARQAEQFRITRADADLRYQQQQDAAAARAAEQAQEMAAQRKAQEAQLAAQLKAQQEAEAAAKLDAEKARNRGRSMEAVDTGTVQKNKQMQKSKKKARLGTKQLTNPLTALGIKNLGIGSSAAAGSGNGLNIAQIKKY